MAPTTERRAWMPTEDDQLKDAVQRSQAHLGRLDWNFIADRVPGRDRKACRKRWHQPKCANVNMGRWTAEEDERLIRGVHEHGHGWSRVAEVVETRNGDQCLKRWTNYLNPRIQHSAWTEHEDRLLIMAVQQCGRDWARISSVHFPHRSPLSLRHRDQLLRNRALSSPTSPTSSAPSASTDGDPGPSHGGRSLEDVQPFLPSMSLPSQQGSPQYMPVSPQGRTGWADSSMTMQAHPNIQAPVGLGFQFPGGTMPQQAFPQYRTAHGSQIPYTSGQENMRPNYTQSPSPYWDPNAPQYGWQARRS